MKVLLLGGTRFLGRAMVEEGLKRGHEITIFNRGNNKELFSEVEQLVGDRNGDVSQLENRNWDVVIDTCGFAPHQINKIATLLGDRIEHYTYISSISVYKDWIPLDISEDYHLQVEPSEDQLKAVEEGRISPYEHYGALKSLCEAEAEKYWPGRVLNIRAGLLIGHFDYTDRLSYWVQRVAEGGNTMVPGRPNRPIQLIDVRDLAKWGYDMAEKRSTGTFNVTGPNYELTMEELLNTCKAVTHSDTEFVWIDEQFALEHQIQPWTEMPFWIPEHFPLEGETEPWKGSGSVSIKKALDAGLSFIPLENSIYDVYQWEKTRQKSEQKTGISREKEKEMLNAWYKKEKNRTL
ncbi:NAD-dependent epimerase/dehydratase family protein [Ferdinandcohnia quinoae]|uniref:UDP-glucose 4-epimerase n=1 Tax=Fredinandcohnia quinoae TaxID=2918902 RepID=A0AAW5E046_9BACI|nr:NAD-dependent epimerase/dehydratase family protein [Fredinandcohnia sp. SECRCQ15]MCH1625678.1 NAD-dependent dehydratase [Fredinandcohnia sp. SECRCQ15]